MTGRGDDPLAELGGQTYDEILAAGRPRGDGGPNGRFRAGAFVGVLAIFGSLALLGTLMTFADRDEHYDAGGATTVHVSMGPVSEPPAATPFRPARDGDAVPSPFVVQGRGSGIVAVEVPEPGLTFARISYSGTKGFFAREVDADGVATGVSLYASGPYQGVQVTRLHGPRTRLSVTANGAWRLELRSVREAPVRTGTVAGTGDDVFWYDGQAGIAELTMRDSPVAGTLHVVVYTDEDDRDPIGMLTSDTTERERWPYDEPVLVVVRAGSAWEIQVTGR